MEANDAPAARSVLLAGVAGYQPTGGIVDWVHCERVGAREGAAALG
jgi:hypothetical protein